MDPPNFWHFISQLGAVLYQNHMVLDRQGSATLEIPNHWISPTLDHPVSPFWTVRFYLFRLSSVYIDQSSSLGSSTFGFQDRPVSQIVHWFESFGPSSLIHDRPVSVVWTVQLNPHGPSTLDLTRYGNDRNRFLNCNCSMYTETILVKLKLWSQCVCRKRRRPLSVHFLSWCIWKESFGLKLKINIRKWPSKRIRTISKLFRLNYSVDFISRVPSEFNQ